MDQGKGKAGQPIGKGDRNRAKAGPGVAGRETEAGVGRKTGRTSGRHQTAAPRDPAAAAHATPEVVSNIPANPASPAKAAPRSARGAAKKREGAAHETVRRRLLGSGLFDADFYMAQHTDVATAGIDALDHYIRDGAREGRDPSAAFDAKAYLARHPEAAGNPLLHYLDTAGEGTGANGWAPVADSADRDDGQAAGRLENRRDADGAPRVRVRRLPEAASPPGDAAAAAHAAIRQRLLASGLFDADFYRAQHSDVSAAGVDALDHYIRDGAREGRDPSAVFDAKAYVALYPEAAANPLIHYLDAVQKAGDGAIPPLPVGSGQPPDSHVADSQAGRPDPAAAFPAPAGSALAASIQRKPAPRHSEAAEAHETVRHRLLDSGLFDADFYRAQNGDVSASGLDALDHYIRYGAAEGRDPSAAFDTRLYLALHPTAAGGNALLHYLDGGGRDGRTLHAVRPPASRPTRISWAEWRALAERVRALPAAEPQVDVIIPIYRGIDETANCLYATVSSRLTARTPIEVVAIDDCSPEPELADLLNRLSALDLFRLLRNERNSGFVATVNRGMSLHRNRDVVLLNSDTEVYGDWIDRLHAAGVSSPRIGTVTPFSNNATICSYPKIGYDFQFEFETSFEKIDGLARETNSRRVVDIPTGVGFCMYIRRRCLEETGLFDVQNFGVGYGEESDFCFRAKAKGWRNVLAGDVFVRHRGRVSFQHSAWDQLRHAKEVITRLHPSYFKSIDAFLAADPIKPLRRGLDLARLRARGERAVMMVSHNIRGGTEKHIQDMCALLEKAGVASYILRPLPSNADLLEIVHPQVRDTPNIGYIDLRHGLADAANLLGQLGVFHLHIHHLFGYSHTAFYFFPALCEAMNIQYDFTFHDYLPACPRVNMIDASGVFCDRGDLAACEACIQADGSPFGDVSVGAWRASYERLLRGARRLFAPDDDIKLRLNRLMPGLGITLQPHPEADPGVPRGQPLSREADEPLRVAVIGNISAHKGSRQLKLCAEDALRRRLPVSYVVFGHCDVDLTQLPNVEVTGLYRQEELQLLLAGRACHLAFFPAVCPESYCFTLSEALFAGLFPVAFDLGAQARRIRADGWGLLLPFGLVHEPGKVNDALLSCRVPAMPDRDPPVGTNRYPDFLADYYGFDGGQIVEAAPARAPAAQTEQRRGALPAMFPPPYSAAATRGEDLL